MTDERDRDGRTALHVAVFEGRFADVEQLLAEGANPNVADNGGRTPLHFAAQELRPDEARALCAAGASIDARDAFGNTPLWRAVFDFRGRGDVIELLLANGADPDAANDSGVTPRELARRIANYDVGQLFPS